MNPRTRHRLSICFHESPRSRPVRITSTLALPSRPVAAIVRLPFRRPQSPLARRNGRP